MAESSKGFMSTTTESFPGVSRWQYHTDTFVFSEMITEFLASKKVAKNDLGTALECLTKTNTCEAN